MMETPGATVDSGIGGRLRAARERSGLTVLQAATKLHLEARVIESLEQDDFAVLGAPVYVRGHLRRYAEMIGAPAEELLAIHAQVMSAVPTPDISRVPKPLFATPPRQLAGPVVTVIVAGAVIAGIWLALKGLPPATAPTATAPAESTEAAPAAAVSDEPPDMADSADEVPPTDTPPIDPTATAAFENEPSRADVPAAAIPPPVAPSSVVNPAATQLKIAFKSDSWVEVYDARGERLYYDIGAAQSAVTLSGRGPLRVMLGNTSGVALEVDGRAAPIPNDVRSGDTAQFVISRSGSLTPVR